MSKDLLKLIETVNPDDTVVLDEIDRKVRRFIFGRQKDFIHPPQYTRSRDALKIIRPDGWFWNAGHNESNSGGLFAFSMYSFTNSPVLTSPDLPTEELAELHVIIQAIQWERDNE